MVTYTEEELEEYLIENGLYDENESLDVQAMYHGFKWDIDIQRYFPA